MTNDTRSPAEIEREIERERAGLTHTLDDLQQKFSIDSIARQFSDQFREHGGDIGRAVSDSVKRNPMALALTGVGLAWLMMGDRSAARDTYDRDRRYRRVDREDGYDRFRQDDRFETDRAASATTSGARSSQLGNASKPYYSGRYGKPGDTPSWARTDDDQRAGVASRLRDAGAGISDAASSAADTARGAGSAIADKARNVAGAASNAGERARNGAQALAGSASDRASALRDRLAEGTENLSEEARKRVIAARESAIEARDAAMTYARQGRDRAIDLFEDQPLIAGALAVAVGAALGAALPRSRMEDEYLGEQSDHLMEEAERIFEEEKQKLSKVAKAATDEAKKVLDDAKGEAENAAKTAMDSARKSGERIAHAAESEAKKQNVGELKKS